MSLRDVQQRFCHTLHTGDMSAWGSVPHDQNRFFLHHHNCVMSLLNHLAEIFPRTQQVLGGERFTKEAIAYSQAYPPRTPYLIFYGEDFASFLLERIDDGIKQEVIAFEERLRCLLQQPLPEKSLDLHHLGTLAEKDMGRLCFRFHASTVLYTATFPLHRLWEGESVTSLAAAPSYYFMHATLFGARFKEISGAEAQFISALRAGQSLKKAVSEVEKTRVGFCLTTALTHILPHVEAAY